MKDNKAVVVFTGKDLNIMRAEGGSGYWLAKAERLNDAKPERNMGGERPRTRNWLSDCKDHRML